MQCQLIQNFLNLPGIIGLSLTSLIQDEASKCFHSAGFINGHEPDGQPVFVHHIQQILKTTPVSLEFCAFQFGLYQVELHKVDNGAILLIVSEGKLSSQHSKSVSELMQFIKADYSALVEGIQSVNTNNRVWEVATTSVTVLETANVADVVAAMNSLSQITSRYLGPQLVANHWHSSQSQDKSELGKFYLDQFHITANGTVSVIDIDSELSPEQLVEIRLWMHRFHQRCTHIIRDYDALVEQALPARYWQLLFGG